MTIESQFEFSQRHDIRNLDGAPGWFELATPDPQAAADYLGKLFDWRFHEISLGGAPYLVILLDGHEIGGIRHAAPAETDAPKWSTYVTVADAEALASRATEFGAEIAIPPMSLGDAGRMTAVRHPAAGTIAGFQYGRPFS